MLKGIFNLWFSKSILAIKIHFKRTFGFTVIILFADQFKPHKMSDEGSDAEVYEVEKLLEKKVKKGKTEYLVKWKGWHLPSS